MENFDDVPLTTVSFSKGVPPLLLDRRIDKRHMSVLRSARVVRARRDELCLVRNISSGGLMAHVFSLFQVGERLVVELKSSCALAGHVVWQNDLTIGMEFHRKIELLQILGNIQEEGERRLPRLPRLRISERARLRLGADYHNVHVCDISQRGAKVQLER